MNKKEAVKKLITLGGYLGKDGKIDKDDQKIMAIAAVFVLILVLAA